MTIRFEYYSNTENVEFTSRPMNVVYTMMAEIPIIELGNISDSIFSFFDNLEHILDQSLQNDQVQKEKATRDMIKQLGPYKRLNQHSELLGDNCTICLDNFELNQGYRTLHCGHSFHKKCIDKWLREGSQECPICRANAWEKNKKENEGTP